MLAFLAGIAALGARADFQPKAEKVVDNVYAIVGPLGQRNAEIDGLNANFGFVVTPQGVILIDSCASLLGAKKIEAAIAKATRQPVRWVVNPGSQDHRWLGNAYFAGKGAEVIAMSRTAATQAEYATQHMEGMTRFLGKRMQGSRPLAGDSAMLQRGGEMLELTYPNAHFPGDAWAWLAQ